MFGRVLPLRYMLLLARPRLRLALTLALASGAVASIAAAVVFGGRYFSTAKEIDKLIASLAEPVVSTARVMTFGPQPLAVQSTSVLSAGSGSFDIIATVQNPSSQWALRTVTYSIALEGAELGSGTTSFLPDETRTLAVFDVSPQRVSPNANVTVTFSDTQWMHLARNPKLALLDVETSNAQLTTFSAVAGHSVTRVIGTVTNRSVMQLDDVPVLIIIKRGNAIVGVGQVVLANLRPSESRPVDFRFPTLIAGTSAVLEAHPTLERLMD